MIHPDPARPVVVAEAPAVPGGGRSVPLTPVARPAGDGPRLSAQPTPGRAGGPGAGVPGVPGVPAPSSALLAPLALGHRGRPLLLHRTQLLVHLDTQCQHYGVTIISILVKREISVIARSMHFSL